MDSAKLIIEVTAAVLPPEIQWGSDPDEIQAKLEAGETENLTTGFVRNRPVPQHTRRFAITGPEWEAAGPDGRGELMAKRNGEALGYAALLMLQPDAFSHVRVDWLWM